MDGLLAGRISVVLCGPLIKSRLVSLLVSRRLGLVDNEIGKITYNGHKLHEFCVQRTSAYISQTENNIAELTIQETLDFGARCEGEGFAELTRLEKENKIRPSPEIDASMKTPLGELRQTSNSIDLSKMWTLMMDKEMDMDFDIARRLLEVVTELQRPIRQRFEVDEWAYAEDL
nr:ABC transporter G family member 31 [Tanacetum cinerariifolium]